MTDLYEALRAAIAPDGRVRLTLPLLTAMREESERRKRCEALKTATEAAFKLGLSEGGRDARERAETAERERDEALKRARALRDLVDAIELELVREQERGGAVLRDRVALLAFARACLDPEIVSRDPAHRALEALCDRIEGGK